MKNLIGISGKIGSGKDTVGNIILYLTDEYAIKDKLSFAEWLKEKEEFGPDIRDHASNWEIKKYADKLKDMTCLLLGCTREQLEDQDFKNTILPEMWDKYAVEINGRVDFIGSKEDASKQFDHYVLNLKMDSGRIQVKKVHLTPRLILQWLGTDCGRDIIHENIWVNSLFADYQPEFTMDSDKWNKPISKWIITDMRFGNELEGIKARGGITIRINRDWRLSALNQLKDTGDTELLDNQLNKPSEHPSETALDGAEFDYVIDNNGTIEDLINAVSEILKKEGIV